MRLPIRPPGGFNWERPGFTFQIGFPPGYSGRGVEPAELTEFEKRSSAGHRGAVALARTQVTPAMRSGGLEAIPSGRGTLSGMGRRTETNIAINDRIRRGSLGKATR
jgi:hypothetical protein